MAQLRCLTIESIFGAKGIQIMRYIIVILLLTGLGLAQVLPDAPSAVRDKNEWHVLTPQPTRVGFWTFRNGPNYPSLRSNREVFRSKTFLILNGLYAASVVTDVEYTHGKREARASEYPVIPAIIGLDYVMDRFFTRAFSVEAPIYGIQHYVRDAFKGK